jgi:carboxymethylenebutenolidase
LSPRDEAAKPLFDRLRASITPIGLHQDHVAYLDFLSTQANVRGKHIGVVGYCMSGAIALHAAADFPDRIVAAASFHGGRLATDVSGSPHLRAAQLRGAQLYFGYAAEDASMPEDAITRLEDALFVAGVDFSSDRYAGKHGFAVPDSPSYDAASAELHWQKLSELLQSALGQETTTRRTGAA